MHGPSQLTPAPIWHLTKFRTTLQQCAGDTHQRRWLEAADFA